MAPPRRSYYEYEDNSSDEMSDATNDGPPPRRQRTSISSTKSENSENTVRRRVRGPSKKPCPNKNAQMARLNREKKKQYVESLEGQLNYYTERTERYKRIIHKQSINERRLQAEVNYLKSVLRNKSSITKLLESLNANLNRSRPNQEQTCSSQNERSTPAKFPIFSEGKRKQLLEDSKIESGEGLFHHEDYDFLAETDRIESNYGGGPLLSELSSKPESLGCQLTPPGMENNYQSLQDNLSLVPSSLDSFDIFEYCGLDEANALDIDTPPDSLPEESYFNNSDNLGKNSGICLHVNSSRVSLEFCASCQMNSIHSEME
ncbi:CREB/ATF bZIP transcription factor-like isoform X2 [Belonocnema kinseyi]|uniref:CREB/ATF bZIP transcription factor-like isoform X2 n=1 Tax=Belonocnema kinseyi TaxID=2817044 RepID=UPI00143DF304|nr:CREB/ATF bZIP transcription factor-like isoform X2 [Belonocnema kinseyi]